MRRAGLVTVGASLVVVASFGTVFVIGCGAKMPPPPPAHHGLPPPVPECQPTMLPVVPFMGDRQLVLSSLRIADFNDGFDLDGDGTIDNKLAPLGGVANGSISDTFKLDHSLVIPIEVFGYSAMDTACTKFAFYIGRYNEDRDHDGADTSWAPGKADCDDTNPAINPHAAEMVGNRIDDDCDGYADNPMKGVAPTDTMDLDGDGQTLAQGDCDDRANSPMVLDPTDPMMKRMVPIAKTKHKGAKDICGNGIDEDCDGIADDDPTCDPYKDNKVPVHVQSLSFQNPTSDGGVYFVPDGGMPMMSGLRPLIVFPDGKIKSNILNAGPDLFQLTLPIQDFNIQLTLSAAQVQLNFAEKPAGTYVTSGKLGGVLEGVTLAQIKGIKAGGIINPQNSLLDAIFAGPVATILGLDSDADGHYLPDIDVDGDGLETFWQAAPVMHGGDGGTSSAVGTVDTCKDGDGTIVHNNWDGMGTSCALAKDPKGNYRFVDGLSAALKFTAVPVTLKDVVSK